MPQDKKKIDPDAFWDLEALMPPKRRAHGAFAKDIETVAVTVQKEQSEGDGSIPIPPPDPERMARAREALRRAEEKLGRANDVLKDALGAIDRAKPSTGREAPSDFADERELAYLRAQRTREEMEWRYRNGNPEQPPMSPVPPMPPVPPSPVSGGSSEASGSSPTRHATLIWEDAHPENPMLKRIQVYQTSHIQAPDPIRMQAEAIHATLPQDRPSSRVADRPIPFFSVIPRYHEMDEAQREWYLSWREQIREGSYLPADSAYVSLYAYELLNLTPDPISPSEALSGIIALWRSYRATEKRLDYLVPEWIVDLCLIYALPAPDLPPELAEIAIRVSSLKEFFLGSFDYPIGSPFANAVYRYGCNYRFRTSKFRTPENEAIFDTHIPTAFLTAFTKLEQAEEDSPNLGLCPKRAFHASMVRQSFAGSSFARHLKRRVDLTYLSCTRSIELRFMATDLVKYCENQVRRICGIKSRFHTSALDERLKAAVDAYFAPLLPKPAQRKRKDIAAEAEPAPEWAPLYEAKSKGFDPASAKEMEKAAWNITRQLVESFTPEEDGEIEAPIESVPDALPEPEEAIEAVTPAIPPAQTPESDADPMIRKAFALLLSEDQEGFAAHAKEHRLLPLTLAERMNELALDELGDIAVEDDGGGLTLIDDYKEDIKRWMNL